LETIIEARDLTKVFISRRVKITAVDNVSFDIFKGEIFGMIGPNGAGKSTIFAMMSTLIKPTGGSIKVAGFDAEKEDAKIRSAVLSFNSYHPNGSRPSYAFRTFPIPDPLMQTELEESQEGLRLIFRYAPDKR